MNLSRLHVFSGRAKLLALGALVLAVVAAFFVIRPQTETQTVTARFSRAVQIYEDSEVRVLGVPVGRVTAVIPRLLKPEIAASATAYLCGSKEMLKEVTEILVGLGMDRKHVKKEQFW